MGRFSLTIGDDTLAKAEMIRRRNGLRSLNRAILHAIDSEFDRTDAPSTTNKDTDEVGNGAGELIFDPSKSQA